MPDPAYLLAAVVTCVAVTWSLRALPFAALTPLRASRVVGYLGTRMPVGVMVILAAYTLRDFSAADRPHQALATGLALAATLGLHLGRRNAALSTSWAAPWSTPPWPAPYLPTDSGDSFETTIQSTVRREPLPRGQSQQSR
jgi:branched-subunit amino acid transport protein AzlD